jgi:hypothetical protein
MCLLFYQYYIHCDDPMRPGRYGRWEKCHRAATESNPGSFEACKYWPGGYEEGRKYTGDVYLCPYHTTVVQERFKEWIKACEEYEECGEILRRYAVHPPPRPKEDCLGEGPAP